MAITSKLSISKATSLFKLTEKTALTETDVAHLDDLGVQLLVGNKIDVIGPKGESIVTGVNVQPGVVTLAKEGLLGDTALSVVHDALVPSLVWAKNTDHWLKQTEADTVYKWHEEDPKGESKSDAGSIFDEIEDESIFEGMGILDNVQEKIADDQPTELKPAKKKKDPAEELGPPTTGDYAKTLPPDQAKGLAQVPLKDANYMYQPVNGTSETSRYHCVGLAGPFKFAARYKNHSLSIRIEGPVLDKKTELVTAGFNAEYAENGKYTSVHFSGVDEVTAARALGAILSGTGLDFETPMPKLKEIEGEGH